MTTRSYTTLWDTTYCGGYWPARKPDSPCGLGPIRPAAQALIKAGIPVGTLVFAPALARNLLAEGFSFIACGSDAVILARGADSLAITMRG
jgi:4-hydroxy-2-oxoheptanedioate aldolase